MTLHEARQGFYESSATLSKNIRKLFLAGIAIIWIFKTGEKTAGGVAFSRNLFIPLGVFAAGLVLDAGQYLYQATVWWFLYFLRHRQGLADNAEARPWRFINGPSFLLFYLKVFACGVGYFYVLRHIWHALLIN